MGTKKKKPKIIKEKVLMGVQQNLIHADKDITAILEYLCSESNNLHNCAMYYARQVWFKTRKFVSAFDISAVVSKNKHFAAMPSDAANQTIISVGESVKSFAELLKKSKTGELQQKPQFPNYRKSGGMHLVTFPKRSLKLINGQIRFPLGLQVKAWFGIKEFFLPMPTNIEFERIKEVRILPRNRELYLELVYEVTNIVSEVNKANFLSIDHGINNWLTCVSNIGASFIIDGKKLKSENHWYNKQVAKTKKDKPQGFWSNKLAAITEKRNRQMRDAVNKAARTVINYCVKNNIGTIIFGWNKGQKQNANMGTRNNQNFVQLPTAKVKARIQQLCLQYGLDFVETEESYTSKSSFLDNDDIPIYGEKPENWKPSGTRRKRGYITGEGFLINADCNGAANIARKVAARLKLDFS